LFKSEIVYKKDLNSSEEIIKILARMSWRHHWENIIDGKMKLPLIDLEWVKDKVK